MALHLRQGLGRSGKVEIVDMPVLDALDPFWKTDMHEAAMLGLFEGNDQTRSLKVLRRGVERVAERVRERNTHLCESAAGVNGQRSKVRRIERKSSRVGPPREPV